MKSTLLILPFLASCTCQTHSGIAWEFEVNTMASTREMISVPILATRNNSNDCEYQGHGYSDSKAAAEDAPYHADPSSYDGRPG